MEYSLNEKVVIWLTAFEHMTEKRQYAILDLFEKPQDIFEKFEEKSEQIEGIVGKSNFDKMKPAFNNTFLNSYINNLNNLGITVVTIFSHSYPKLMSKAFQPPIALFCKGEIALLDSLCLAVVGTRKPTAYGKSITEKFTKELCQSGFTIVSGLAYGIDTVAHETTLASGGKTIAVLGGGFNNIYPQMNVGLANEIAEKGLLVSEFAPSTAPTNYTFPKRNRTVALLSQGVLITEASNKSGTLHTKNFALEEGREVFATPGNINSEESKGSNEMIRNGEACCVLCPEDIATVFKKNVKPIEFKKQIQLSIEENLVADLLRNSEVFYDDILSSTGMEAKKLNGLLTTMQIRNIITKLPGNYYTLL
ncbi:MAG: DNA-processing protein DprA [Clostridia bacterium]